MSEQLGAYITHDNVVMMATAPGPLTGLNFVAKDLFDISGHTTGAGSPDWLASHSPATNTASSIEKLLAAGACMVAKAQTDEMAFSITGQNAHYGTPQNVNAPGRIPGGSSSGSAAAVGGSLVEFAIGSDTGGSVRIPASFCGIYGIRTTQDRIPVDGVHPLAPRFDTIGWFAKEAHLMQDVGRILLPEYSDQLITTHLLVAQDCFDLLPNEVAEALINAVNKVADHCSTKTTIQVSVDGPETWMPHFRTLQMANIWSTHGDWIKQRQPSFGPGVAERFIASSAVTTSQVSASNIVQIDVKKRLMELLGDDHIICLPTAPGIAPLCTTSESELDDFRWRSMGLTCIAGLSGCPQINLPLASFEGCPLGISLIAPPGKDEIILTLAASIGL